MTRVQAYSEATSEGEYTQRRYFAMHVSHMTLYKVELFNPFQGMELHPKPWPRPSQKHL